jgi:hypothetical protein
VENFLKVNFMNQFWPLFPEIAGLAPAEQQKSKRLPGILGEGIVRIISDKMSTVAQRQSGEK